MRTVTGLQTVCSMLLCAGLSSGGMAQQQAGAADEPRQPAASDQGPQQDLHGADERRQEAAAAAETLQQAQQAGEVSTSEPQPSVEEVVVVGVPNIDRSLEDMKQDSLMVVDGLNFEAINLFPDDSIGGILDRVVGVSAISDPSSGQPRFISVRGFDARYNSVDFDGIPILNSSQNNRGTRLDVFPTSLLHEINVYKTYTPDMDGNSIGGHVSARTLRAFDGGSQPYWNTKVQVGEYEQEGRPDRGRLPYRFDMVGKSAFGANNRYGVVFGVDLQQHEYTQDSQRVSGGYDPAMADGGQLVDVPARDVLYNAALFQTDIQRASGFGKLELRNPADTLYGFLSLHFFSQEEIESRNRTGHFVEPAELSTFTADSGVFSETQGIVNFIDRTRDRQTLLASGGLDRLVGGDDLLTVRASWSKVDLDTVWAQSKNFVSRAGEDTGLDDLSYRLTTDRLLIDLPDPGLFSDPAMFVQEGTGGTYNQVDGTQDYLTNVRVDYSRNIQPESTGFGFKAGGWWRRIDRDFEREALRYRLSMKDQAAYPLSVNNPGLGNIDTFEPIFIDRDAYWGYVVANNVNTGEDFMPSLHNFEGDYRLVEDVVAGYGMLTHAFDDFRLIGGVRVERTDLSNDAFDVDIDHSTGSVNIANDNNENAYTELLPSAHLHYTPRNNLKIRLSYARSMARPDFEDFAQRTSYFTDAVGNTEIIIGDPDLGPRTADNYDLSGEYYFERFDGYVSLGVFYKDMENESYSRVTESVTDGLKTRIEEVVGDSSARESGIEANFVLTSLDFLPPPLNGLGLFANFTYIDAEWDVTRGDGVARTIKGLRNQSKELAKVTLRYRWRGRLGIDLAVAHRGRYFTGAFGDTPDDDIYVQGLTRVTFNSWYLLTDALSAHFSAGNVNSPKWVQTSGRSGDLILRTFQPGPSYWLGLKYRL